jgi:hypothetical protein
MYKARAFFFVCAGIFLLALAYHLGARSAGAQAPGGVECIEVQGGAGFAVIDGYSYMVNGSGVVTRIPVPVPGKAVACLFEWVLIEDGRFFNYYDGVWSLAGTLPFGGATPAQSISIGQLKAKYAK